ncbi:phosphoribosylamine--glycine ligase [Desulfovibrio sp. OttesenSCG-928-F07]|nr:phosphoribosylamine--glycine ligase [Desulfovibrio sp. OttesenSCG-928-F07]
MRILIIGSGGREHALAWKLSQNPAVTEIHVAPGNGGTEKWINIAINAENVDALMEYAKQHNIDFVVPGGETSLVAGITDACMAAQIPCFGPDSYAAQLEGSKIFAKEVMREAGVPTAGYAVFEDYDAAAEYVRKKNCALVIKADGLAAGKGVVVAPDAREALIALDDMMRKNVLGNTAASRVLIEDTLIGEEVSLLAFCDGEKAVPLSSAQDHKRAFDGDTGPNTGGMGAYSPAPLLPDSKAQEICDLVITPVLNVMKKRGHPFKGIMYAGLMYTEQGPMVLEYNVRFGDPECQPLLMRLETDLIEVMQACIDGKLEDVNISFTPKAALCVVLAAKGYPGSYSRGFTITGIEEAEKASLGSVNVFHAGTFLRDGDVISSGGRVLGITALGNDLSVAKHNAYAALEKITMPSSFFRRDIGDKGLNRCWACSGK